MDRISNLPDEIICYIGSFFSAKEAAFAIVLSKRWRNLFTIIPKLHFYESDEVSFTDFADQVFALPFNSFIKEFSITIYKFKDIKPAHLNRCISHALKHGVMNLDLHVIVREEEEEEKYSLPLEIFTCKTLVKLILGVGFVIDFLPKDVSLPALKSLRLCCFRFNDPCDFNTLLSASPVLEELDIYGFKESEKWSRIVSSLSIKRLKFHNDPEDCGSYDESEYESMIFDTPALAYLEYSDCGQKGYLIVDLNSLVEAKIHICYHEDILSDPLLLFNWLKNVEFLSLTGESIELIDFLREAVPMFENLTHLSFATIEECCWFGLKVMLEKSPKLKTFTIEGPLHYNEENTGGFEPLCECLLGYSLTSF